MICAWACLSGWYLGQISKVSRHGEVQLLRLVVGEDPREDRVLVQVVVCPSWQDKKNITDTIIIDSIPFHNIRRVVRSLFGHVTSFSGLTILRTPTCIFNINVPIN